jgi:glycosyltransferase involved in cell wall biosynthesis
MVTVLNVIDTAGPGGAETIFLETCARIDRRHFNSVCVVSEEGWLTKELRGREIEPHVIPSKGSLNFSYLWSLMRLAREKRPALIVGHLFGSSVYCSMTGALLGIPVISILHGHSDIAGESRLPSVKKLLLRLARRVVFVSGQLQRALGTELRISKSRSVVIPNGIDFDRFSRAGDRPLRGELDLADDKILVGAVGNIRAAKSYETFLQAANLLSKQSDLYHFVIAGEGSGPLYNEVRRLCTSYDLDDKVTFLGLRTDVPAILRSLDVYVLSSITEGFSIACVEAMAAGIPVVATRSGGPEEILEHGQSGLLVPVKNPHALAAAVQTVSQNPTLRAKITATARSRVKSQYTLQTMIESYEQLFTTVAGSQ